MPFGITTQYPPNLFALADVRATFRNVVAGALRRSLQEIADQAASASADYPTIAAAYDVVQASSGDLALGIVNHDPDWIWTEYPTQPHFPPTRPDGNLAQWVERKGMEPRAVYPIAQQINREGTTGHGYLTAAWEAGREAVMEGLYAAVSRWWQSWGTYGG